MSTEDFRAISTFETITKVYPKDCLITEDTIFFLIDGKKISLAIGKGGSTIKEVSRHLGKSVKLFEYSEDPQTFIKNMVPSAQEVKIEKGNVDITVPSKERSAVIGREGKNIKAIKEFAIRHLGVTNLRLK